MVALCSSAQTPPDEPEYLALVRRIQKTALAFTNFEMLVHNFEYGPAPMNGGMYLQAYPFVLEEMKWMGFGIFGSRSI